MDQNNDAELTKLYEENGLFAKIIDTPAEEAFRRGFTIKGDAPEDVKENVMGVLEWGKRVNYEHPGWKKRSKKSLEAWYSYVEGIQNSMVKANLWQLLFIVFWSYVNIGILPKLPKFDVEFEPLWYIKPMEQAEIDRAKAEQQMSEAQTAAIYVEMGSIAPKEVRRRLRKKKNRST